LRAWLLLQGGSALGQLRVSILMLTENYCQVTGNLMKDIEDSWLELTGKVLCDYLTGCLVIQGIFIGSFAA
jgi:hypothetical protein